MRVFEYMGCGVPVVTDLVEGLPKLFEPGRDLLTYKSESELLFKVGDLLRCSDRLGEMADRGYKTVMKSHTYRHRAGSLLRSLLGRER